MNKPYLLIAGDDYYPSRLFGDWKRCYVTFEEAQEALESTECDWSVIVDLREWVNRDEIDTQP